MSIRRKIHKCSINILQKKTADEKRVELQIIAMQVKEIAKKAGYNMSKHFDKEVSKALQQADQSVSWKSRVTN